MHGIGKTIAALGADGFETLFSDESNGNKKFDKYPLLTDMMDQVNKRSYSNTLKDFGTLIRLKSGRESYQLLSDNLPIPSTISTDKYLSKYDHIVEGELQVRFFSFCQAKNIRFVLMFHGNSLYTPMIKKICNTLN